MREHKWLILTIGLLAVVGTPTTPPVEVGAVEALLMLDVEELILLCAARPMPPSQPRSAAISILFLIQNDLLRNLLPFSTLYGHLIV